MDASHFAYENFIDSDGFNKLFTESERLDELRTALYIKKIGAFMRTNSTVAGVIEDRERNSAYVFS